MCESRKEYEEKLNERLVSAEKTIEAYHNLRDDLKTVIVEKIRLDDPEEFACYNAEEKKVEIIIGKTKCERHKKRNAIIRV